MRDIKYHNIKYFTNMDIKNLTYFKYMQEFGAWGLSATSAISAALNAWKFEVGNSQVKVGL